MGKAASAMPSTGPASRQTFCRFGDENDRGLRVGWTAVEPSVVTGSPVGGVPVSSTSIVSQTDDSLSRSGW